MAQHPFLSPEWIAAARDIKARYRAGGDDETVPVRMNLVIEDVPFAATPSLSAHLDTTSGLVDIDLGHLEEPDATVTIDYLSAKAILVDANSEAAVGAYLAGKIRVDGDVAKLLAFQAARPGERQLEMAEAIREITAS